jgi:hypothetical protein
MHEWMFDVEVFGIVKHCDVFFIGGSKTTGILIVGFWGCEGAISRRWSDFSHNGLLRYGCERCSLSKMGSG